MSFTHHDHHHGHAHHDDDRSLTILYATETGNSQDTADRIAAHLRSIHMNCRSHDIGEYPLEDILSEPLVIFVVSTTGSGTEPRDATPLMDSLLRSDLPTDLFDELHYAVFGLGDSSYEKFCWPAKVLDRRLEGLGARRICERGEADDQHALGIDGALDPWLTTLTASLLTLLPLPPNLHPLPSSSLPPARVKLIDISNTYSNPVLTTSKSGPSSEPATEASTSHSYPANNLSGISGTSVAENNASRNYHKVKVLKNVRITVQDWWQDVRHFEFGSEDELRYEPGDVAVIHPEASSSDVDAFLECMGWENEADRPFWVVHEMKDQSLPSSLSLPLNEHISHLPQATSSLIPPPPPPPNATTHRPLTLRQLVMHHLDINAVPRRGFFRLLRHFTEDEREMERLDELGEANELGANDLYDYATRPRRTIREVMEEFRGVKGRMPREYVFEMLPPLRPRMFSIASDVETHPKEVHLCVAIVQYKTKLKIPRRGVCTSYLSSLKSGTTLLLGLQKGLLSLPPSPSIPTICVGPGTGIAPMRALIERRVRQGARENTLYFGCRSQDKDQHYGQEWERLSQTSVPPPYLTYRPAFSRDNPEGVKRTYVQDLMDEDREKVWDVVGRRGGWVYISGSANKMPAAVRKSIADAARVCGGLGEDEAKEYVERMGREGRLWEECWS